MDTSSKYIKMCKRAKEIQGERPDCQGSIPDWFEGDYRTYGIAGYWFANELGYPWLPTQDQLQTMINWSKDWCVGAYLYPVIEFYEQYAGNQWTSLEQLWLGFVMYKNYKKIWDGKKWINLSPRGRVHATKKER